MKSFINLLTGEIITRYEFINGWTAIVLSDNDKRITITIMEKKIFNAIINNDRSAFKRSHYSTENMTKRGDYIPYVHDHDDFIAILARVAARSPADGTVDAGAMLNKVLKK